MHSDTMDELHRKSVLFNYPYLCEEINFVPLLFAVFERKLVDENTVRFLLQPQRQATDDLLYMLMRRGPHAWEELLSSLSAIGQRHIFERLSETAHIIAKNEDISLVDFKKMFGKAILPGKVPQGMFAAEHDIPDGTTYTMPETIVLYFNRKRCG